MNKIIEYTKQEREKYEKMYVDVTYAVNEIQDFVTEEQLRKRKYYSKISVLKEYIDLINKADKEADGKGMFEIFKSDEKYKTMLEEYKSKNSEDLIQISDCCKCACFQCTCECKFDTCLGCREKSKIVYCDHKEINITSYENLTIELFNNDTNENSIYKVLAVIQDIEKEKRYIIIQNIEDEDDKYILYYYPGLKEDRYEEIDNAEEFDRIALLFKSYC